MRRPGELGVSRASMWPRVVTSTRGGRRRGRDGWQGAAFTELRSRVCSARRPRLRWSAARAPVLRRTATRRVLRARRRPPAAVLARRPPECADACESSANCGVRVVFWVLLVEGRAWLDSRVYVDATAAPPRGAPSAPTPHTHDARARGVRLTTPAAHAVAWSACARRRCARHPEGSFRWP